MIRFSFVIMFMKERGQNVRHPGIYISVTQCPGGGGGSTGGTMVHQPLYSTVVTSF